MQKIYNDNGLPFYTANWLRDRRYCTDVIADELRALLVDKNKAWSIHQIEAPCLIPFDLVSKEYDAKDVYTVGDFYLKPETTASSYKYAQYLLEHQKTQPPLCVWQASKSFRRENDQASANVRLKEFYQQEFQCIVTEDTQMDYHRLVPEMSMIIADLLGVQTRVVNSDRLPSYSQKTLDIEAKTPHKWLEVCSVSKRTDVPFTWNDRQLINYEFAFGLDRLVYVKTEARK